MIENGTTYKDSTPPEVAALLERCRHDRTRIRVHYGDVETGRDWGDVNDVAGRVGRSTGRVKVPLLVHNARSLGGGSILDHCIVRVTTTRKPKRVLYTHEKYHTTGAEGDPIS